MKAGHLNDRNAPKKYARQHSKPTSPTLCTFLRVFTLSLGCLTFLVGYCWNFPAFHIMLSHDVHPNPGPNHQVLKLLSLNVGGPHLSKRRWGRLLQETSSLGADVIALQEVRFRDTQWNMAATSQLLPNYCPVFPTITNPDVMFLLHSRIASFLVDQFDLPSGFGIKLKMPGASTHTLCNLHGPFTTESKRTMDNWLASRTDITVLMGDFNDRIWGHRAITRIWHTLLLQGKLIDPLLTVSTRPTHAHTRGAKRIDAILTAPTFCTDFPLIEYQTLTLTAAGDHKGVLLTVGWPGIRDHETRIKCPTLLTWRKRQFAQFRGCMANWSKSHPPTDNHLQRYTAILEAMACIVEKLAVEHQPKEDPCATDLYRRMRDNPSSDRDRAAWADFVAARQEKRLQKGLRQLRAGAIKGQAVFFKTIAPWLLTSNRPYNPLPPLANVKALLPCFAGDPPWSLTEGVALLNAAIPHPQVFRSAQPTWEQFQSLLHRPMSKASGPDGVPPHLLHIMPPDLKWDLFQGFLHVWHTQEIPQQWLQSRITLLYKKGDPNAAENYRPITIATPMYVVLTKWLWACIEQPLRASLSHQQAGGRKGRTTTGQAMTMLALLQASPNPLCVCLVDIAKAFPSVPHPLLYHALRRVGFPDSYMKLVEQIYSESTYRYTSSAGAFPYKSGRGMKEGCPLSPAFFMLVYEGLHCTLAREFPSAHFLVYVDDIAIITSTPTELEHVLA